MFAGLPGFGVGTLFYVVVAFWMPVRELARVARGTSSLARWRLIAEQLFYACGVIFTIMIAERVLMWALGQSGPQPFSPAALLGGQLGERAPDSLLAAPIAISLLMVGGVVLSVEILRLVVRGRGEPKARDSRSEPVEVAPGKRRADHGLHATVFGRHWGDRPAARDLPVGTLRANTPPSTSWQ